MSNDSSKVAKIREDMLFKEAKKIKFKDYKGKFILDDETFIQDKDDIEDWLYYKIKCDNVADKDLPKYLWATKSDYILNLNLKDIIYNQCEDGYEDMYGYLNTDDEDLKKAQEHLNKWCEKQGDKLEVYDYDCTMAVSLDDLINEIKNDIRGERI